MSYIVISLLLSWLFGGKCINIPTAEVCEIENDACIANITRQYLAMFKGLVYINEDHDNPNDILLKKLQSLEIISFTKRKLDMIKPNRSYMVVAASVLDFSELTMSQLVRESNWNPNARFLFIFKSLESEELRDVFDIFLSYRVYDVVVMNGTNTAELYSYNPYENYACGRYYTRIIYYGKCSEVTADIYPKKTVTGLKNCFFNVSVPHWPPWGIDPSKTDTGDPNVIGTEQYIFHLMSEIEQFKYKFKFDYDPETFSTVSQNLTISGPMTRLDENQTDVMLGGLILISSRANAFMYICGYLDYMEEIRIIVQRAGKTPAWKDIYFEFSGTVWALLFLSLFTYSVLMILLLKTRDKGRVILILLDSLLTHGSKFHCQQPVKCVVIVWVAFAYLVNNFYTTTLMSLTTKPSLNYQITNVAGVLKHRLEPCISQVMGGYMKSENNHGEVLRDIHIGTEGCIKLIQSVKTVSKSRFKFTIALYSIYYSNRLAFYTQYGEPSVYSFSKPYTKVIYAMYFKKGFPMERRLRSLALRIREVGLADKSLSEQYFSSTLKHHFRVKGFVARFAIPWYLYGIGVLLSTMTFAVEIASLYRKVQVRPVNKTQQVK